MSINTPDQIPLAISFIFLDLIPHGPLHYRNLEMNKLDALKLSAGKFDTEMNITFNMKVDLRWWLENLSFQKSHKSW
jgi:hypothetical protein